MDFDRKRKTATMNDVYQTNGVATFYALSRDESHSIINRLVHSDDSAILCDDYWYSYFVTQKLHSIRVNRIQSQIIYHRFDSCSLCFLLEKHWLFVVFVFFYLKFRLSSPNLNGVSWGICLSNITKCWFSCNCTNELSNDFFGGCQILEPCSLVSALVSLCQFTIYENHLHHQHALFTNRLLFFFSLSLSILVMK